MNAFLNLFNFKRYPQNVFFFAIPLATIGISAHLALAYLHFRAGDPVYAYIFATAMIVLAISLIPAVRMHRTNKRLQALLDRHQKP